MGPLNVVNAFCERNHWEFVPMFARRFYTTSGECFFVGVGDLAGERGDDLAVVWFPRSVDNIDAWLST